MAIISRETVIAVVVTIAATLTISAALSGNDDDEIEYKSTSLKKIKGLHDCSLFAIESNATKLYVVRCPNSEVSVRWNENRKPVVSLTSESS